LKEEIRQSNLSLQAHRRKIVTLRHNYTNVTNLVLAMSMAVRGLHKRTVQLELAAKTWWRHNKDWWEGNRVVTLPPSPRMDELEAETDKGNSTRNSHDHMRTFPLTEYEPLLRNRAAAMDSKLEHLWG
jgi:hypothetical protein